MIQEIFLLQNPWREDPDYRFDLNRREILDTLLMNLDNELILGLTGSRQVGKSSILYLIIRHLLAAKIHARDIFYFNLDDLKLRELFTDLPGFIQFIGKSGGKKYIFIDEVQRLPSPGLFLKGLFDLRLNLKIVYTGSSQLEVKAKTKEHLVGRARVFGINRLSFNEYLDFSKPVTRKEALSNALIYGTYPATAKERTPLERKMRIKDIYQSYVQRDLTDFLRMESVEDFNKLLIILANQVGNLLNNNAISNSLGLPLKQVQAFLDILEYTFICKRIYPFHQNYKKEITKTPKLYFLDTGLRNYILGRFDELNVRNDTGSLFENFFLMEMLANDHYGMNKINFWRTTNQTEIDFIVKTERGQEAIEVRWKGRKMPRTFDTIRLHYPEIRTRLITAADFTID